MPYSQDDWNLTWNGIVFWLELNWNLSISRILIHSEIYWNLLSIFAWKITTKRNVADPIEPNAGTVAQSTMEHWYAFVVQILRIALELLSDRRGKVANSCTMSNCWNWSLQPLCSNQWKHLMAISEQCYPTPECCLAISDNLTTFWQSLCKAGHSHLPLKFNKHQTWSNLFSNLKLSAVAQATWMTFYISCSWPQNVAS